LEKESISLPEIVATLGDRPFPQKDTIKDYLAEMKLRDVEDEEIRK
jgi:hypothetical protein